MTPEEFKVLTQEYLNKAESFIKVNDEKTCCYIGI